jgi:hypothetical protein
MSKRRRSRSITGMSIVNVGDVARPHLRAHQPSIAVDQYRKDHLPQIRPMVLDVAMPACSGTGRANSARQRRRSASPARA